MASQNKNTCVLLSDRELGGSRRKTRPVPASNKILRGLYLAPNRRLRLQGQFRAGGAQLSYEDGVVFYPASECGSGGSRRMTRLRCLSAATKEFPLRYSIPMEPQIKAMEVWSGPLPRTKAAVAHNHRRSLFVLRKDNHLYRYDLDNGRMLEKLLLSDHVTHAELTCDATTGVVTKSVKNRASSSSAFRDGGSGGDVLLEFKIFDFPPLALRARLQIRRSQFGASVEDAEVFHNMLFVMSERGKRIAVYDLRKILDAVAEPRAPYEIILPNPVLQLSTFERFLDLGDFRRPRGIVQEDLHTLKVIDLSSLRTLGSGVLHRKNALPTDEVFFHNDGSPRVVHVSNSDVRIYRIEDTGGGGGARLKLQYSAKDSGSIDFSAFHAVPPKDEDNQRPVPTRSQPSRTARRKFKSLDFTPPGKVADAYNEELNLSAFVVASSRASFSRAPEDVDSEEEEEAARHSGRLILSGVALVDPLTCTTLRKMKLDFPYDSKSTADTFTCSLDAEVDLDTLAVKVRPMQGSPTLYIYKLTEEFQDCDARSGEGEKKSNAKCARKRAR